MKERYEVLGRIADAIDKLTETQLAKLEGILIGMTMRKEN